jgi:NitT/TauT family transport system ATP-binding protein
MNLELLRIWKRGRQDHRLRHARHLRGGVPRHPRVVLTAGPARMADNFEIDLPHPRTLDMKTHERFGDYTRRIYRLLGNGD